MAEIVGPPAGQGRHDASGSMRFESDLVAELHRLFLRASRQSPGGVKKAALAKKIGVSVASVYAYFNGATIPPSDKFDDLLRELGASAAERRRLCTVRDEIDVRRTRRRRADVQAALVGGRAWTRPPRQLPAQVSEFTGRRAEIAALDGLLEGSDGKRAAVVSVLTGTAGVGKTALAVLWAHRVGGRFPDGQLYVNLRGFDPAGQVMAAEEAVRGFLDALGVPAERIPSGLDAQAALYRSLVAGRRVLVVLDNAVDAEQVRPLLPGGPGCMAVVTSRNELTGLIADGAYPLTLDMLSRAEARALLAGRLGSSRIEAEPEAVEEIIGRCVRLPLALAVVSARAATHPGFTLAVLAGELGEADRRLDALAGRDPGSDVRAVFSWSYQALSGPAARLFRLLGLHPGPDISTSAVASLAGVPAAQVRPALAELAGAHLAFEHLPGRYAMHDLLRGYAAELAAADPDEEQRAALCRVMDHYLGTAHHAARLLYPHRDPIITAPLRPGVTPEELARHGEAMNWFTAEHSVLLAVLRLAAADGGFDTHVWQFAWTLRDYLNWQGYWTEWAATQTIAVAATARLADPDAGAQAHRGLARAYTELGRLGDAHAHLRRALDLSAQVADRTIQAHTDVDLAEVYVRQGRHRLAIGHAQAALEPFRVAGHLAGQARALNQLGWCHALLGEHAQALVYCGQALSLHQQLGNQWGEAGTWDSLGYAHHHLGRHTEAVGCYQHALDLYRQIGDRYGEADVLTHLGDAHQAAGHARTARATWQRALEIIGQSDHPTAGQIRSRLHPTRPRRSPGRAAAQTAPGRSDSPATNLPSSAGPDNHGC